MASAPPLRNVVLHGTTLRPLVLVGAALLLAASCAPRSAGGSTGRPASPEAVTPGRTIAPAPTIRASPIPMPTTARLSAPSAAVLWAFVGSLELFRSVDRGDTWQQRPLPSDAGPIGGVSFIDDAQGWLVAHGSAATQCQAEATAIWRTVDAGTTWARLSSSGIAAGECNSALSFVDRVHGFLVASGDNHPPVIYRSADSGQTWSASSPLPDPPGFIPGGSTLTAGQVHALGSTLLVQAGSYVFRSSDGGATWSFLATSPLRAAWIAFVTPTRWLGLIVPAQSRETTDAGATWHPYASDYTQAAPVAPDIVFADPQVGYATVRGSLQRSLDGGLHWSGLRTPGTSP